MEIELKPCPFCGSHPAIAKSDRFPFLRNKPVKGFTVICENFDCPIYHADNTYFLTENDAIEAWNRRVNREI